MRSGEGVKFEEIPFSEIEARLMIEMGVWRNFDEIEDSLILDELLLLIDTLREKEEMHMRMQAALQGVDIPDSKDQGDEDLPPELIEMERKFREERAKRAAAQDAQTSFVPGIGYSKGP